MSGSAPAPPKPRVRSAPAKAARRTGAALRVIQRRFRSVGGPYLWCLAIILGTAVGFASVGFRWAITTVQYQTYGVGDYTITIIAAMPWWIVFGVPVGIGLIVGLILQFLLGGRSALGVSDVIRARDLGRGRVNVRDGLVTSVVAALSLGGGASTGREGPVVHLGATIASAFSGLLRADAKTSRTLMGCAAAAGVSALFNAPIAGTVFALEVVLGRYSVRVFAPIVAASVAGAVVNRSFVGDFPAFLIAEHELSSFWLLPAFVLLGLFASVTAVTLAHSIFLADRVGTRIQTLLRMPLFLRPALAGVALGAIAYQAPEVVGVGYASTSIALGGSYLLQEAALIFVLKILAVAVSFGGRFGGGVFSPSLMLGALLGAMFGFVLQAWSETPSAISIGLFALAGMGAVSASMLGAPISTTLIVFEITGDYRTALAVMVAVSIATVATQRMMRRSFFYEQLERAGIALSQGRHVHFLKTRLAEQFMREPEPGQQAEIQELVEAGASVATTDSLGRILRVTEERQLDFLPVVDSSAQVKGVVLRSDALHASNHFLRRIHAEDLDVSR